MYLDKINYHGKRADGIVKNMLEHSRAGTGTKILTDINKLCEEYINLAYHGIRSKDSSFTCTIEKHFAKNLPEVNIIPQDIGRVLLNIFNNAFYAVNEKSSKFKIQSPKLENEFFPNVSISTQSLNGSITISIKDNGNGIPESIRQKIFEPFFTTKPTGEGTGLGLSLSYDIVKAHGGEIKIESEESKGTNFIIELHLE